MSGDTGTRATRCPVCLHPSRLAIDQSLLNGKAMLAIARDFRIGSEASGEFRPDHKKVQKHRDRCLGEAYRAAREEDLEASGMALINRMKQLDEDVDAVLTRAREGTVVYDSEGIPLLDPTTGQHLVRHNDTTYLAAIREARRNVEMRAKLAGAVPEGDEDAVTKARAALENPRARAALADLEKALADVLDKP